MPSNLKCRDYLFLNHKVGHELFCPTCLSYFWIILCLNFGYNNEAGLCCLPVILFKVWLILFVLLMGFP